MGGFASRGGTPRQWAARPRRPDGECRQRSTGALDSGRGAGGNGQPVLQDVRITPDTVNNTLLIYADQANYRIIEATLIQIDQPQLQVAIDATIAEVTLNNTLSYGVQSYLTSQNFGLKPNQGSILNTQATTAPRRPM